MIVGPDHPMFNPSAGMRPAEYFGPGGVRLPPGAVPPGARFDPIVGGPLAGVPPQRPRMPSGGPRPFG